MTSQPFRRFSQLLEPIGDLGHVPLEWEIIGDDLWLRPQGEDVEIAWCYLGSREVGERLAQGGRQGAVAEKKIGKALAAKRFWRFWPSTVAGGDLFLRRNFGLIRLPDKLFLARFKFRAVFKDAEDVLMAEPERVRKLVTRVEGQDDFREALVWLRDYEDEWSNVVFKKGSRAELEALLKGFWAVFRPHDSSVEQWGYFPGNQTRETLMWAPPRLKFPPEPQEESMKRRLFALVHEHIVVVPIPQRRYLCTGVPEHMRLPFVLAPTPSMHDRMEGLLAWREFLRGKLPDAEIDALFGG